MRRPNNRTHEPIEKGARLRIAFEHAALQRLISEVQSADEDFDRLCKALHAYCELRKQDAALEKNKLDKTKGRQTTPRLAPPGTSPQRTAGNDTLAAPFGVNDRGNPNPNTNAQFQASLRQTISDLYGTGAANPESEPRPTVDPNTQKRIVAATSADPDG